MIYDEIPAKVIRIFSILQVCCICIISCSCYVTAMHLSAWRVRLEIDLHQFR